MRRSAKGCARWAITSRPSTLNHARHRRRMARPVLIARVTAGEPVRIAGANIVLEGGAKTDEDYLALVKKDRPTIGERSSTTASMTVSKALTSVALRKGYFDSQFIKSQLGVALDRHQAFWDIDYDSGERYRFGEVTFEGSQIREEYLQNLVPFQKRGLLPVGRSGGAEPSPLRHRLV